MSMKNIKLFILTVGVSLPFWLAINYSNVFLEDFFLGKILANNPPLQANIANSLPKIETTNCQINNIKARAFVSAVINKEGISKILFAKNERTILPIASITKLLSALVVEEFLSGNEQFTISKEALNQLEPTGSLQEGETFSRETLLKIGLIESSNDAIFALSEPMGLGFIFLMNEKAKSLAMNDSLFFNSMGLDPEDIEAQANEINISTGLDLIKLAKEIMFNQPEVLKIISQKEIPLYLENGFFHHTLKTTNELLGGNPYILGGKTGSTERAGGCLLLILKTNQPDQYIVNVILGSGDRFGEMETLNSCSLQNMSF